ncbi:MAG: restriction endonuclease subunit S [Clostridia bacterium]|nr:restriction endonuclease subunit S [Clostridia bacterium]
MTKAMKKSGVDWVGMIPEEWNVSRLKYIGQYINGYAFKPEQWGATGRRIIRIQDLTGSNDNPNYYDGEIDTKYLINNGDILVSWAATLAAFIWNKGEGLLNQHIFKATNNPTIVMKDFFFWLIKVAMEYMNNENKHGIVMQHVTLDVFGNFKIALPPLEEQSKISTFLDIECSRIDSIIEHTRASIDEYKKLKQSIITEAVTHGIRGDRPMKDSGIEWVGEIPAEWEVKKLKYVADFVQVKYDASDGNLNYIGLENITGWNGQYIETSSEYDREQSLICEAGDILFGKLRPYLAKVYISPKKQCCSGEFAVIRVSGNNRIRFFWYQLISHGFVFMVDRSTYGTKMPRANVDFIKNIGVSVPTITEQDEIVQYLDSKCIEMHRLINSKQQILIELESYKKSLIYEYVTGKKEI